jgi:hypothetical protein
MKKRQFSASIIIVSAFVAMACNSGGDKTTAGGADSATQSSSAATGDASSPKGIGPHQNVELTHPLDEKMVAAGKSSYEVKCQSCHKLTDERLVGPGWKGVTDRRTPEWIMNFITNVDEMIDKDTAAQKMLEECLVRMPNQNVSEQEARSLLEFMRKNDGKN